MNDQLPETEDAEMDDAPRPVAFISHHSSQEETARHLKTILERNGITGWMAPDDIDPGLLFDKAIVDEVRQCDMIILLFCAKSDQSDHVRRELTLAVDNKKMIYPVRLEDIDAEGLAYWLSGYQWVDWLDRRDATIQRLVDTIKHQAGNDGLVAEGHPKSPAGRRKQPGGGRALWLGGGAALAIAGLGGGWYMLGGEGEVELKILSGSWTRQLTAHSVVASDDEAAAESLFASLDLTSSSGCIGDIESTNPGISFFDPDGGNNCTMEQLSPGEDTKMLAEFICRPVALNGATANFVLNVTPDRDTKILADGNLTIRGDAGERSLYEVEFHYLYSGKDC